MAKHHKITLLSASIYLSKKSSVGKKKIHLVDLNFGPNLTEDFEKKKKKNYRIFGTKIKSRKKIHLVNLDFDPNLTKDSELKKRKKKRKSNLQSSILAQNLDFWHENSKTFLIFQFWAQ